MDSILYKIDGVGRIHIGREAFPYTYAELQEELDYEVRRLVVLRDALTFIREHMAVGDLAPDAEFANAKYASDVQTAWAQMGAKGGAM